MKTFFYIKDEQDQTKTPNKSTLYVW